MRTVQPAAASGGAFVRNAIVSAVAGLTVVAFMTAAYLAPKPAAPVTQPQITAPAPVAPQPAAPVVEQAPVASKATSIHHRAPRHAAVATPTPEPTQVAATPQPTPTKQRRVEKLDERHRVKD